MKNLMHVVLSFILIGLVLSACTPLVPLVNAAGAPTVEPVPATTSRAAQVQRVDIQITGTNPQQVTAVVRGSLSESCATLDQSQVQYASNTFHITVYAVSPTDRGCAQVTSPFETTIALDTSGLPSGSYTVIANGVSAVFALQSGGPAATAVPTTAPTAASTSHGCTDSAAFVSDVSIPDNFRVAPGTYFTKTWRLKNTGSCSWNNSYLVSYIVGTTMTQQPGYWLVGPGERVDPGQTLDVTVGMSAPMQNGIYTSYWGLKGRNGQFMPISGGANGNSFFVKIKVDDGNLYEGRIIAYSVDVELAQGSAPACTPDARYVVTASFTADGPVIAPYELNSSAGQIPAGYFVGEAINEQSIDVKGTVELHLDRFPQGGEPQTVAVPHLFVGPYPHPDDITFMLRVDDGPWHNTKLQCP